jgi:hypothetical protein
MRLTNALFALLFTFSVGVQVNDPDPVPWMLVYGSAVGVCVLWHLGRLPRGLAWGLAAGAVLWGVRVALGTSLQVPVGEAPYVLGESFRFHRGFRPRTGAGAAKPGFAVGFARASAVRSRTGRCTPAAAKSCAKRRGSSWWRCGVGSWARGPVNGRRGDGGDGVAGRT